MSDVNAGPRPSQPKKRTRGRPACNACDGADMLLQNARRIFAQRGFYASSVREIAKASGVDAALISHHFGSKEALWIAVVEQIAAQTEPMLEAMRALRESPLSPCERVETAVNLFIDRVFDAPDVGMFFSTATTEEGERLDFIVERLVRPFRDAMFPLLHDGLAQAEPCEHDPEVLFTMLIYGISKTVAYQHVLGALSQAPSDPVQFKRSVRDIALGIFR